MPILLEFADSITCDCVKVEHQRNISLLPGVYPTYSVLQAVKTPPMSEAILLRERFAYAILALPAGRQGWWKVANLRVNGIPGKLQTCVE